MLAATLQRFNDLTLQHGEAIPVAGFSMTKAVSPRVLSGAYGGIPI
jgi:hypothetical protein